MSKIPWPKDPIIGMIMGQGHAVIHIGFFIASYVIKATHMSRSEIACLKGKGRNIVLYKVKPGINELMD